MTMLRAIKGELAPAPQMHKTETEGVRFSPVKVTFKWQHRDAAFKAIEALTEEAFDSWEESLTNRQ